MRGKYQRQLVGVLGDPVDDNPQSYSSYGTGCF